MPQKQKIPHEQQIQNLLEKFDIKSELPRSISRSGCQMNLTGFQKIKSSVFVIDVDKEINKQDSKIQCEGKKCDYVVWVNGNYLLIEVKSSNVTSKAIKQLENTWSWIQSQGIPSQNKLFIVVANSVPASLIKPMREAKIIHVKCGECVWEKLAKNKKIA